MKLSDLSVVASNELPDSQEFHLADDIFIKSGLFKKPGTVIAQHSHEYDHTSFIATGGVRAWCDDEYLGEFIAPISIFISKHTKHTFITSAENTLLLCIHNISRNGMAEIHDLHGLEFP